MTVTALLVLTQIVAVSVDVRLVESGAVVTTNYRLRSDRDSVVFHAMRYDIAPIEFILGSYPVTLEQTAGTYRFAIPVLDRRVIVRYVYQVSGDGTRIPVFVPNYPSDDALTRGIRIRVRGPVNDVALENGFPRWSRESDSTIIATPANVPSFLHVPRAETALPVSRAADVVVIGLILVGSAWWVGTRVRASRSEDRPAA